MKKWEYRIVAVSEMCDETNEDDDLATQMNKLGADGWEFVETYSEHFDRVLFKREATK